MVTNVSHWVPYVFQTLFWRYRPAARECPVGRRMKIRHRERHREHVTWIYNRFDVGSLFHYRMNILRSAAGPRQEAVQPPPMTSYGVRIDIGRTPIFTAPGRLSAGTRPMIRRRIADHLPASVRCPADYNTYRIQICSTPGPPLLTWFNLNPSLDK